MIGAIQRAWRAMRGEVRSAPFSWPGFDAGWGAGSPSAILSNLSVAARCVSLRSELLASVPLRLYRRTPDGGRTRADDLPLAGVLNDLANPNTTAFEARELMTRSLDLYGNAYATIESDSMGRVTAITPATPSAVSVEQLATGRLRYRVANRAGGTRTILQDDMLHVRASSDAGVLGRSPIAVARGSLELAMTQASAAQAYARNGLRPSGVLSVPGKLTIPARNELKKEIASELAGASKAGRVLVLDTGMKMESIDFTLEDQEFLAQRRLANEDIARIFGVPQGVLGVGEKSTYASAEQEARALVQNCLAPLAARIEQAMMRCLLTTEGRRTLFIEHDLSGLLRGDVQARFNAYRIAREIGVLSANDIRRRENEPPIENGDTYLQPLNLAPLGSVQAQPTGAAQP